MATIEESVPERAKTEVSPRATRRRFSTEYKARMLKEADAAKERGQLGALLRREGLYSSHIQKWRVQVKQGLSAQKRGPKPKEKDPRAALIAKLESENRKLKARSERAEAMVELQKKVSVLMGLTLPSEKQEES